MTDTLKDKIAQVIHDCDMQRDSFRDIAQAIIAGLPELQGWQPIETAPKDKILIGHEGGMMRLILWEDHCWKQVGTVIERNWFEPTHWMPLPDAPAIGIGGDA